MSRVRGRQREPEKDKGIDTMAATGAKLAQPRAFSLSVEPKQWGKWGVRLLECFLSMLTVFGWFVGLSYNNSGGVRRGIAKGTI